MSTRLTDQFNHSPIPYPPVERGLEGSDPRSPTRTTQQKEEARSSSAAVPSPLTFIQTTPRRKKKTLVTAMREANVAEQQAKTKGQVESATIDSRRVQNRKDLAAAPAKPVMESGKAWSVAGPNQVKEAISQVARQMDARQNLDSYATLSVEENDRRWVPTPKLRARPPQDGVGRQSPRATPAASSWLPGTANLVDSCTVQVPTTPTYAYILEQARLPSTMADPRQRHVAGPRFDRKWLTKAVPVVRRTAVNMRREGLGADHHGVPGSMGKQGKLKIAGQGGMGGSRCGTILTRSYCVRM
jgi:hypothetical protein